jgi:hypothetical protein
VALSRAASLVAKGVSSATTAHVPCHSMAIVEVQIEGLRTNQLRSPNECSTGGIMNGQRMLDFSQTEAAAMNANLDAYVLDEDGWEDATDESSVDCETFRHSQWRSSTLDSTD